MRPSHFLRGQKVASCQNTDVGSTPDRDLLRGKLYRALPKDFPSQDGFTKQRAQVVCNREIRLGPPTAFFLQKSL